MALQLPKSCTNCGGDRLFTSKISTSGYMPLLFGLGRFFSFAKLNVVVCADCGHLLMFADDDARSKLRDSQYWKRV